MPSIGPMELAVILFIIIAVFGVGKVADIGKELGRGLRELRQAAKDVEEITEDG